MSMNKERLREIFVEEASEIIEKLDVEILNFRFEPEELTISVGDSVMWVNEGSAPHTVDFEDIDGSGTIRTGNGFERQFDEPGTYEYWCNNHPGMEGTIIVE